METEICQIHLINPSKTCSNRPEYWMFTTKIMVGHPRFHAKLCQGCLDFEYTRSLREGGYYYEGYRRITD